MYLCIIIHAICYVSMLYLMCPVNIKLYNNGGKAIDNL